MRAAEREREGDRGNTDRHGTDARAWDAELERRLADYDAGRTKGIPAEEVFRKLRERFKMKRIIFDPEAEAEMIDAATFHENERAASGARLIESIEAACEIILERPFIGEPYRFG